MKIITKQLAKKLPSNHHLLTNKTLDNCDINAIREIYKNKNKIIIYDATKTKEFAQGETIKIINHINRTGHNPLIGRQKEFGINFLDITKIYNNQKGVITDCCGNKLDTTYQFPSHYLCHFSILAAACGIKEIYANLINIR